MTRLVGSGLALLWATSCAQILGTDEYEEDPSAFAPDASQSATGETEETGETETEATETEETDAPDATPGTDNGETETEETDPGMTESMSDTGTDEEEEETDPAPPASGSAAPDAMVPVPTPDASTLVDPMPPVPSSDADAGQPPEPVCQSPTMDGCDTAPQCGCQANEMCSVVDVNTGAVACEPAGDTEPYAECSINGDCQAGYACVGGVCKELCDGSTTDTCPQGEYAQCVPVNNGAEDIPGYFVCFRTCDPTNPQADTEVFDPCGQDVNCLPGEDGVSYCLASEGSAEQGDPCETVAGDPNVFACAPGFACVTIGDTSTCRQNCELGGNDCDNGGECLTYGPPLSAADKAIGYCGDDCPGVSGGGCDPVTQCGCGVGEMCAISDFETGETGCVPEGITPVGGGCDVSVGQCAPGSDCMQWLYTGVCSPFCNSDEDCPNQEPCVEWEVPGVKLCLHGCDLRDPLSGEAPFNACAEGQNCALWTDVPDSTVCINPDVSAPNGATCYGEDTCGPGLTCTGVGDVGVCRPWCDLAGDDCDAGSLCFPHAFLEQYLSPIEVKGVEFGICLPPQFDVERLANEAIPDVPPNPPSGFEQTPAVSAIQVSNLPSTVGTLEVEVNIGHTFVGDLVVILLAPNDEAVTLFDGYYLPGNVASGANLEGTVFTDAASTPIGDGTAPFTGQFQPEGALADFDDIDPNGDWILAVYDLVSGDVGTLVSWRLRIY